MNKKGFTLVEMIAVVAIIGIIFGIASYGVIGVINNSKKKSEEVFVEGISTYIDEYIALHGSSLVKKGTGYNFTKSDGGGSSIEAIAYEYEYEDKDRNRIIINMQTLIDSGFVTEGKFINPVNKLDCLSSLGNDEIPVIRIFKDSDYVYYYYVNLSNTMCDISSDNSIINTLPDELKEEVGLR